MGLAHFPTSLLTLARRRIPELPSQLLFLLPLAVKTLTPLTSAANTTTTKRGVAYLGHTYTSDNSLLLQFTPLIHGLNTIADENTMRLINGLPDSSRHLLTFNEPDGSTSSGDSDISPLDAAKAYIKSIVPYRNGSHANSISNRRWNIPHPSVTGSTPGLDWLRKLSSSFYSVDPENGCPTEFIAVHWYGDFAGLAVWLGTLGELYNINHTTPSSPKLKIWITEMALPQQDGDATVQMMNQEKYAWSGAFRTGDEVALFDKVGVGGAWGAVFEG
ncbi:uncharacterized protein BDR25DRAFT_328107 [Lindgomyces ingoldianus]|uniref:Uncharacterized protein n=1 Tax=Lindgomyces ingoldianus TaxID=673940 RepID=A0ACB6QHJ1_9PLEO|nr:uncharacterized protein BDR25DRAFT_328107 [Lindgomyces ingoldianus]KAF2466396.1 hypothetical protein BDR25DRAFT_328107 [Lindgomyces ingoldianus]